MVTFDIGLVEYTKVDEIKSWTKLHCGSNIAILAGTPSINPKTYAIEQRVKVTVTSEKDKVMFLLKWA